MEEVVRDNGGGGGRVGGEKAPNRSVQEAKGMVIWRNEGTGTDEKGG